MLLKNILKSVRIQGNIKVVQFDEDDNEVTYLCLNNSDGLDASRLEGMEKLHVRYIYAEKFTKYFWRGNHEHQIECARTVIEVGP